MASRNSITPSRALCTSGEFVFTTIPGWTGQAHDATGFGARSTSTRHIRPTKPVSIPICGLKQRRLERTISRNQQFSLMAGVSNDNHPKGRSRGQRTRGSSICCKSALETHQFTQRSYLGIVAPAFSQAWMRAEPASTDVSSRSMAGIDADPTFNRDLLAIWILYLACIIV